MRIYFALDKECSSYPNIKEDKIGGTERYFKILGKYLRSLGHEVITDQYLEGSQLYDLAIHSNTKNKNVVARKHICRAGSYHTDAKKEKYDLVISISQFFADYINNKNTVVIPVCYDKEVDNYYSPYYEGKRIITTANPNRHYKDTLKILDILTERNVDFTWDICGGNKIYSTNYQELFDFNSDDRINYLGILPHKDMLQKLSTSHFMCYPNFSDNSETFCVAIVEAAALGIPVVLPKRKPFTETLPDNPYFCRSIEEMSDLIESLLNIDRKELVCCDVDMYSEEVVLPKIYETILNLFKE